MQDGTSPEERVMRLAETLSDIRECISTFPRRFGALPVPHDLSCHATLQKAKRKRCWRSGAWQLCAPALRMCDSERVHCAAPLTVHPGPAQLRVLHHHHHPRTDRTRLVPPPVLIGHASSHRPRCAAAAGTAGQARRTAAARGWGERFVLENKVQNYGRVRRRGCRARAGGLPRASPRRPQSRPAASPAPCRRAPRREASRIRE